MNDRQLIEDLLSALEYHTEQTRPIQFSKVAIEAAREYLRKPAQQEPVAGSGKELSERLKLCARNVAFVAAGRVDMSSAAMQEMFALIDHVCVGIDSPQPAQPVAWCVLEPWLSGKFEPQDCFSDVEVDANVGWVPLYTSPQTPAQPWVELTDAEIDECEGLANIRYRKHTASARGQHLSPADGFLWHCARAIEAKLKEKNT